VPLASGHCDCTLFLPPRGVALPHVVAAPAVHAAAQLGGQGVARAAAHGRGLEERVVGVLLWRELAKLVAAPAVYLVGEESAGVRHARSQ